MTQANLPEYDYDVVIIGGGPVNQEWADRIGADGYGKSAIDAVALAKGLIAGKK